MPGCRPGIPPGLDRTISCHSALVTSDRSAEVPGQRVKMQGLGEMLLRSRHGRKQRFEYTVFRVQEPDKERGQNQPCGLHEHQQRFDRDQQGIANDNDA